MLEFTLEYSTVPGIADPAFLDRLADRVYDIERFSNIAMFLNGDGSLTATFELEAADPVSAINEAGRLFVGALLDAEPLCFPARSELEDGGHGANDVGATIMSAYPRADELARHLLAGVSAHQPHAREDEAVPA